MDKRPPEEAIVSQVKEASKLRVILENVKPLEKDIDKEPRN